MEIALFIAYLVISLVIGRAMQNAWGYTAEPLIPRIRNVLMTSLCWPVVLLLAAYDQIADVPEEDWLLS
jgi:putative copper export protein